MPDTMTILGICGVFVLLVTARAIVGARRPVSSALGGVCAGLGTFLCVNLAGIFTGVTLPCSLLALGVSAAAGVPGVTLLLFLNLLFR